MGALHSYVSSRDLVFIDFHPVGVVYVLFFLHIVAGHCVEPEPFSTGHVLGRAEFNVADNRARFVDFAPRPDVAFGSHNGYSVAAGAVFVYGEVIA